jgi:CheY-like chemotaxis protein
MAQMALAGVRILCVDDHDDSLVMMKYLLEDAGALVETATSAAEGLAICCANRPDILISDLRLPDDDGLSLVRNIRECVAREVPSIALTGLSSCQIKDAALAVGFSAFLTKPVDNDRLVDCVTELSDRRRK